MINLTSVAASKVKEIMAMQSPVPVALRVAVVGGGCSGFQYHMAFENQTNDSDEVLDFEGRHPDYTAWWTKGEHPNGSPPSPGFHVVRRGYPTANGVYAPTLAELEPKVFEDEAAFAAHAASIRKSWFP